MLITRKKSLEANFALAAAMLLIYYFWRQEYLLLAAIFFAIVGLLIPPIAQLIAKGWFRLAEFLGRINSIILLSVLFFLILTPLALIRRGLSKPLMPLGKEGDLDTYFITREHDYTAKDLTQLW